MPLLDLPRQLTVPDTSIMYDQIGPYLLTVDKNHRVILKRITLGPKSQGKQGVLQGLNKDELVIVDGIQNAVPGNQVQIVKNDEVTHS